jgi:hypothetical protein
MYIFYKINLKGGYLRRLHTYKYIRLIKGRGHGTMA